MTVPLIDTHIHLLPEVDDGSPDLDATVAFARAIYGGGIRGVVCTPHLRTPDDPSLRARDVIGEVRRALDEERIPLEVHEGWELAFSMAADLDMRQLRGYGLAGSRYVLLEVPHTVWPAYAEEAVHRVRLAGMVPVLAHPERNARFRGSPELAERLIGMGAVLQGTTSSLLGLFGSAAREALIELLAEGRIGLLATDAHYDRPETWDLGGALKGLGEVLDGLEADLMASRNPAAIIADGNLQEASPARRVGGLRRYLRALRG